jgi:tRNA(Ile)-lysidine synthase
MRPLGLHGSKTLSDLFTDRRIPRAERASLPIVLSGAEIAWVPSVATGDPFRVREDTQRLVLLRAARPATVTGEPGPPID